jgi:hypothetical protein
MFSGTKWTTVCIKLHKLDKLLCQKGLFQSWILIMILIHNTGKANSIRGIAKKTSLMERYGSKRSYMSTISCLEPLYFFPFYSWMWIRSSTDAFAYLCYLVLLKKLDLNLLNSYYSLFTGVTENSPLHQIHLDLADEEVSYIISTYIQKEVGRMRDVVFRRTTADTKDRELKFWV